MFIILTLTLAVKSDFFSRVLQAKSPLNVNVADIFPETRNSYLYFIVKL